MEYGEIVEYINNNDRFKEIIKNEIGCDEDITVTTTNLSSNFSNDDSIVQVECVGGIQDYLLDISITYSDNSNTEISNLIIENKEDIAKSKIIEDKLNFDIDYWSYNITYDQLSRMKNDNKILTPKMQRGFVWDKVQASKLIESIFMGLPLPSLFLIKQEDGKYLVVDGLQRISTIYSFRYNKPLPNMSKQSAGFALTGVNEELVNATYSSLEEDNPSIMDKFDMGTINVIEFKQNKPEYEEAMYSLFERLNSGGTNLTSQQIRNSIYYGIFNDKLNEFSKKLYKYHSKKQISGLAPSELALRTISIFNYVKENELLSKNDSDISGKIIYKNLLNDTASKYHMKYKKIERAERNKHSDNDLYGGVENEKKNYDKNLNELFSIFDETLTNISNIFDGNEFRRFEDDQFKKRTSPILFEALTTTMMIYKESDLLPKEKIMENYKQIFNENNGSYEKNFTQGTGDKKNIKARILTMKKVLFDE